MKTTVNNNKVIIINGSGGVGKDEFVKQCHKLNPKVIDVSMASYCKRIAKYCGWEGEKTDRSRKFLSDLKDVLDDWGGLSFRHVNKFVISCKNKIIFIHSRQPKDIRKLKDIYNGKTILVINSNIPHISSNHADNEVYDYAYDYIIENNEDLDTLKESAKTFLKEIEGE